MKVFHWQIKFRAIEKCLFRPYFPVRICGPGTATSRIRGAALGVVRNRWCILQRLAEPIAPTQKRVPSRLLTKMPGRNALP